jgi:transposase
MAQERLSMRKIKDVLRLKYTAELSHRQVAASLGIGKSVVANYWRAACAQGLTWETVSAMTEEDLSAKLVDGSAPNPSGKPLPDFEYIHQELRAHKHLTLTLLWREYKEAHPDGYQSTQFVERYRRWEKKLNPVMRQDHKGGEKLFTDYCKGLPVISPDTGEPLDTEIFVAVWGASNYTFAEASFSQDLFDWTTSHVHAFEYFGCVPHVEVPDNLKSGVTTPNRYEPEVNRTFESLGRHYGFAVIPARPYRPRDKAKVEVGVQIVERWILARLRHRTFVGLAALNEAIRELLENLNGRELRKLKISRRELFLTVDKPNALPLVEKPFEHETWKKARVNLDYHIEVEAHYYSVPYRLIHETVDVRLTAHVVEIFWKGERMASHPRSSLKHRHTTVSEHMPSAHQKHAEWTPSRMVNWANQTGPNTAEFVEAILARRKHPEQNYRSVLGLLRLSTDYGKERMEKATNRALRFRSISFQSIKAILERGLDQAESCPLSPAQLPLHENIRGSHYYEMSESNRTLADGLQANEEQAISQKSRHDETQGDGKHDE